MKRIIFILIITFNFFSCEDDFSPTKTTLGEDMTYFMPLSDSTHWVYFFYGYDYRGLEDLNPYAKDTLRVLRDTIVDERECKLIEKISDFGKQIGNSKNYISVQDDEIHYYGINMPEFLGIEPATEWIKIHDDTQIDWDNTVTYIFKHLNNNIEYTGFFRVKGRRLGEAQAEIKNKLYRTKSSIITFSYDFRFLNPETNEEENITVERTLIFIFAEGLGIVSIQDSGDFNKPNDFGNVKALYDFDIRKIDTE